MESDTEAEGDTETETETVTVGGKSVPRVDTDGLEADDLLTKTEFGSIIGKDLGDDDGEHLALTLPEGTFYVVGSSDEDGEADINGVVEADDAATALEIV